jgi:hypothetical protein
LGRHETTLRRRAFWQQTGAEPSAAPAKPLIVEVSERAEPQERWGCGQRFMLFPVEVKLALDEPALDLIIEGSLTVVDAEIASLIVDIPAEVGRQIGLAARRDIAQPEEPRAEYPAVLELWFGAEGPRARIWAEDSCDALVFPADRLCAYYGSQPLPASDALSQALQGFADLRALPVTLPDGTSTTLDVELLSEPESVCSGIEPGVQIERHSTAVSARLTSADGQIEVVVEGGFEFDPTAPLASLSFGAQGILPASAARTMPYFSAIGEEQLVELRVSASWRSGAQGKVFHDLQLNTFDAASTSVRLSEPLWGVSAEQYLAPHCIDESLLPKTGAGAD